MFTVWMRDENYDDRVLISGLTQDKADRLAATITDITGAAVWTEEE